MLQNLYMNYPQLVHFPGLVRRLRHELDWMIRRRLVIELHKMFDVARGVHWQFLVNTYLPERMDINYRPHLI
jgi:hypothetical protein